MSKDEFTSLTINTKALWEKGDREGIKVTEQGILLKESYPYAFAASFLTEALSPASLDLDQCGALYILDASQKALLVFDLNNRKCFWIECLKLMHPQSLAVSAADFYMVGDGKISCLARTNCQIRWEQEITEDVRIAFGRDYLYVLDLEKGTVYSADRDWSLTAIELKGQEGNVFPLDHPKDIASDRENNIYILEPDQRVIVKFTHLGAFIEHIPILYEEYLTPRAVAADTGGTVLISFEGVTDIARLTKMRNYESNGTYLTQALDSTIPECEWHKVLLEADIPAQTQVKLSYHASDNHELPKNPPWSTPLVNPRDALLFAAKGRCIWFKIELTSDNASISSPVVVHLSAYFPRISYLRYLPPVYQEDPASRDFLERFLSLFETLFKNLEQEIEDVPQLFDIKATPEGFLPWLSTWLGAIRDENWEDERWKEFLTRAIPLYKQRGTRAGLSEIIKIFMGVYPIIIEPFQLVRTSQDFKEDAEKLFGSDPYTFCLLLKPGQITTETERNAVRRIIDTEKPAHTRGGLQVLQPWIILGAHTYLEVNTALSKPGFILGKGVLPLDTVLEDPERGAQIERHSRTEIDTFIE
jgi:phage tail-like protein